jgi:hypothetical protein
MIAVLVLTVAGMADTVMLPETGQVTCYGA